MKVEFKCKSCDDYLYLIDELKIPESCPSCGSRFITIIYS